MPIHRIFLRIDSRYFQSSLLFELETSKYLVIDSHDHVFRIIDRLFSASFNATDNAVTQDFSDLKSSLDYSRRVR